MSEYKFTSPIEIVLNSEDKSVIPYLPPKTNLPDNLEIKRNEYRNLIRMNNSDRNKAKAYIETLDTLFYKAEVIIQNFYALFKDSLDRLDEIELMQLDLETIKIFDETNSVFNEHVVNFKNITTDGRVFISQLVNMIYNTLNANFSSDKSGPVFRLSDAIELIVYGESNSPMPVDANSNSYNSTKLISDYLNHLEIVWSTIRRDKGISYLKPVAEYMNSQQDNAN